MRSKDAHKTLEMILGSALTWCLPEKHWDAFLHRHATSVTQRRVSRTEMHLHLVERVFGSRFDSAQRREIVWDWEFHGARAFLYRLREYSPYRGTPCVHVEGYRHVENALSRGRGVILWIGNFVYGSVITKMGLASIGLRLHHLSRPSHAYVGSRYARKVLSPIYLRAETRNLAERVVIGPDRGVTALKSTIQLLHDNTVVSITADHRAMRTIAVPFFDCQIKLATGPIELALYSGAPLLPVFTIRNEADEYEIAIEGPIDFGAGQDRRDKIEAAGRLYASRLAPYVLRYAGQYDLGKVRIVEPAHGGYG